MTGLRRSAVATPGMPAPAPRIKQVFHLNQYEKDFGYAQAVQIDKTLYVSGSMAADASGSLVDPRFLVEIEVIAELP